jgi:hypothetical protein
MNKRLLAISAAGILGIGLGMHLLAQNQERPFDPQVDTAATRDQMKTVVYDVACDARTFRLNKSGTLLDARRGDGFIVRGKIYPAGTIPPGGTMDNPGTFDPDTAPGSIGTWVCRGNFNFDIGEILQGANPHIFSSQLHLFSNGNAFVHEGPEGGAPELRAVIGGMGSFAGAAGEVLEEPIGVNRTGLFNIRHTFRIKASSLK